MSFSMPTRRQLISGIPLVVHLASRPSRVFAQADPPSLGFLVIGDWGRNGQAKQVPVAGLMADAAQRNATSFVASTGDNFYTRGVSSPNDKKWQSSFYDIYSQPSLQVPWLAVLGNHDYGGDVDAQIARTAMCDRWFMPKRWYHVPGARFARPDIDLFFIDTVSWQGKESFPFAWLGDGIKPGHQQEQVAWLSTELARSQARTKLVFGHHGIYSIGPHGGRMRLRELDDLLRANNVTAYINGHDHCLYHISRKGMHYICSGGGSEVLATYTGGGDPGCVFDVYCDRNSADNAFARWHCFLPDAGFARFDLHRDRLSFRLIGAGGQVYDAVI